LSRALIQVVDVSAVVIAPILDADLDRVGVFLHENLNDRVSSLDWERSVVPPWSVDSPNRGYMLLHEKTIVGVYLAFYSVRTINSQIEKFCNLAAWCVLPKYRLHSLRLLDALLKQPGYHFTDLSASGNAVPINERLGFAHLDTTTALMPNLPWPSWPSKHRMISERTVIEDVLSGHDLQIYRDHRHARAAHHMVMMLRDEQCYVIFRKDKRKNFRLFASVLYVSNPPLFLELARHFGRYLLLHYGVAATLLEARIVGGQPACAFRLNSSRPKMFKSDTLQANAIDDLYSELMCVAW